MMVEQESQAHSPDTLAAALQEPPKAYVLLLNWNGWADTVECLESLFRQTYPNFRVVVCDNASQDGSIDHIRGWANGNTQIAIRSGGPLHHPPFPIVKPIPFVEYDRAQAEAGGAAKDDRIPLVLIQTGANLGFAGGNNVGIRYILSRGDAAYVWLLNNDTVVDPDALTAMVSLAERDHRIGMVGAKVLHYDRPTVIQAIAGGNVIRWKGLAPLVGCGEEDRGQWNQPFDVDCILGASLLVRASILCDLGYLDERYFMYSEEMDWCLRAKAKDWRLVYSPGSTVWHKEGRSVGNRSPRQDYYATRSTLLLVKKFYPQLLPAAVLYSVYRCFLPKVVRRQPARLKAVARAYADFFFGALFRR